MGSIDRAVWYRFQERFTPQDAKRLREVESKHYLAPQDDPHRDWVITVLGFLPTMDAEPFIGETTRFSARFLNPLGPQSVAAGQRLVGRRWSSVAGEFIAR